MLAVFWLTAPILAAEIKPIEATVEETGEAASNNSTEATALEPADILLETSQSDADQASAERQLAHRNFNDYSTKALDFLNHYSGAFLAVFTLMLLFANLFSVGVAVFLFRENRLLRKVGTEPNIIVYLTPSEIARGFLNLVVKNTGKGVAKDLNFSFDHDTADFEQHDVGIHRMKLWENLSLLPPDEKLVLLFGFAPNLLGGKTGAPLKQFKVTVSYDDIRGKSQPEKTFQLDVSEFEGLTTIGTPPEQETARALTKLAKLAEHWSNGMKRLKVETVTKQEEEDRNNHAREKIRASHEDDT